MSPEDTVPELADGETAEVQGSGSNKYTLKNTGGIYSCSCPAWRNQSVAIETRTCKHLKAYRGEQAELARTGQPAAAARRTRAPAEGEPDEAAGPPLLLAQNFELHLDPTGWLLSEKLDGVRAYWDGKRFLSRLGNPFLAPEWFTEHLPETPLDGELWGGRKKFQRTVGLVKRQDRSDTWKELAYLVFDAPTLDAPFEERLEACRGYVGEHPYARVHAHERCRGIDHLKAELERVEKLGGEGLMLRKPGSRYEVGRSSTLLKVKTFHDAEARVVEHQAGEGRHKGRLGALVVEMADGTRFKVGTGFSDAERRAPPAVGTIITYRYQELSEAGVPRFPSYVGVRVDAAAPTAKPASAPPAIAKKPPERPAEPAATKASSETGTAGKPRRFEFVEGGSSKFWEISVGGSEHTVRFGRIGTQGQTKTKSFATEAAAEADAAKLIAEKTKKGYSEV
jgi:DNA ligase-1